MKTYVKYGLILSGILVAVSLITYALGMDKNDVVQKVSGFLNVAISAVVVFLAIRDEREGPCNGFITFGKGFSTGMKVVLVGSIISGIYSFLYFKFINPGMITYIRMKQEEDMLNEGMSEEMVEKMATSMEFMSSPAIMAGFSFLGMVILGLVLSLILAAILKKEDPAAQIS